MAKKKNRKTKFRVHLRRRRRLRARRWVLLLILSLALVGTALYLRQTVVFYYALYFKEKAYTKLTNTPAEAERIHRITAANINKTFGIDISHYQRREDILWDGLSLGNGSLPIKFVLLRATMGNRSTDRHFKEFWKNSKKNGLVRGAYHFYRPDEDPVLQANNFLAAVHLEPGDLPPVLDIEKIPRRKSQEELIEDLKIWCAIVEEKYGTKPILYTYYHYYKDFLRAHFVEYPLWLANYNDVPEPSPVDAWLFWQFSENGIVSGINTKVDINIFNGSSSDLEVILVK